MKERKKNEKNDKDEEREEFEKKKGRKKEEGGCFFAQRPYEHATPNFLWWNETQA